MIDLHLHLDGSMRPSTVREILSEQGIVRWRNDAEARAALCAPADCRSLNDYLKCFGYPCQALRTSANIIRAVRELGEDLAEQDITYAEIRFAPLLLAEGGLSQEEAVEAAIEGARQAESECVGLRLGVILCCMRGAKHSANLATVEAARRYLGEYVCALDLAGAEALYATGLYEEELQLARRYGIPFTVHAGEAAGPESIWRALELGASRIGHGVRCIEDGALVDYLARYEIPLEVCPTSNMQTRVFGSGEEYPLKELLLNGVRATLNTDNMTVSSTNLFKEKEFVKTRFNITDKELELMEKYSAEAAFLKK
ncbi:MAG: adenosine deaminase [Butyrivibrio sp.]|nr:adenosine deaminase [Butyrivibrio sp.]